MKKNESITRAHTVYPDAPAKDFNDFHEHIRSRNTASERMIESVQMIAQNLRYLENPGIAAILENAIEKYRLESE